MISFARFIVRHAVAVTLIGVLLGGVGAHYSVLLFKNLRTDIEELLPHDARSVVDLQTITRRLESIENLVVLVFADDVRASRRFVDDLVRELATAPRSVIASVEHRIDREIRFFKQRQALFMDLPDLDAVHAYVERRLEYERALFNPLNIFSGEDLHEPRLDLDSMKRRYAADLSSYDRFPDGYYATPDEKIRAVMIYLPGKTSGIAQSTALKDTVAAAIAKLDPARYSAGLTVAYTGGVQDSLEEHHALIADLGVSSVIVIVCVGLALLAFFRVFRATFALLASLFIGVFWTFGISYGAVGYLNANSAFLGSIIIGNGINFGVIVLARYLEERRSGVAHATSVETALAATATPTLAAALAAGLSYGSLILTGFRGFRQFGIIGLIGMVLCWIAAFTMLPALLTLLDRLRPLVNPAKAPPRPWLAGFFADLVVRHPKPIVAVSAVLTVASILSFARASGGILETNLGNLRNKKSFESGSIYYSKFQDQIFQRYLSPQVILPESRADAREIARRLRERAASEGPSSLIHSVQTLDDFVPGAQGDKIDALREIRRLLPERLFVQLAPEDRTTVTSFLTPSAFSSFRETDLPAMLLRKFTERDGSRGKLVLVEPPLSRETWEGDKLIEFIRVLRETADAVSPGAPVAGSLPISADMIEAISRDGPRATLFSFLAVVLLVIVMFRSPGVVAVILSALLLGMLWLAGVILGFWVKINFLNFIALPITFGIGVDYGVNIFQRFRQEGVESIPRILRYTGGAVGLCSVTTVIGYGSLIIADNQGFISFGILAVAGEITCLLAALFTLPAILLLRHRRAKAAAPSQGPS